MTGLKPAWKVILAPPSTTESHKIRWHMAPSHTLGESLAPLKYILWRLYTISPGNDVIIQALLPRSVHIGPFS